MPNITINDADYYYELHGKGQPIVFISGYTVDHQVWLSMLEPLTKYFQVLIFDNRGVGQTKDDGRELTVELLAKDTVDLFQKLNLNKPHIIGQSMGGTIVQKIASQFPDAINKLVIITSAAKWRKAVLMALASHILLREKNVDLDTILDVVMPWVFGETYLSNPENIKIFKNLYLNNPTLQSIADQKRQHNILEKFNGVDDLKKIKAPTLIIHGVEDEFVLKEESEFLTSRIANAHLIKISCGHGVPVEEPEILANELIQFLK